MTLRSDNNTVLRYPPGAKRTRLLPQMHRVPDYHSQERVASIPQRTGNIFVAILHH